MIWGGTGSHGGGGGGGGAGIDNTSSGNVNGLDADPVTRAVTRTVRPPYCVVLMVKGELRLKNVASGFPEVLTRKSKLLIPGSWAFTLVALEPRVRYGGDTPHGPRSSSTRQPLDVLQQGVVR